MKHHVITVSHAAIEQGINPTYLRCTCGWRINCGYEPTLGSLNTRANEHLDSVHIDIETGQARQ